MATQITINGTRKEADGTAASGTVEAKLSHELFDTDGNIVATKDTISTTLDASGDWTLTLYATNDDDTTPTGAYYAFTFRDADGRVVSQYRAEVDNSSTPARFEDLIEVTSSNVSAIGSWINGGSDAAELGSGNATDGYVLTADGTGGTAWEAQTGGGGGVSDGDKGDITVSGGGATWTIDAGAVDASKVAADVATQAELDAEAALARNADNLTSGTVADARIASTIARDSEVTSAISTHSGDTDPHGDRAYADGLASNYATAAQGATADSALQPEDVLDEDDFASNSATQPPSQQSTGVRILDLITTNTDEVGDGDLIGFEDVAGVQQPYPKPGNVYVSHNYTGTNRNSTASEINLHTDTYTIPANEMVIGTTVYQIEANGTFTNSTGSDRDVTFRVKLGGNTNLAFTFTGVPSGAARAWGLTAFLKPYTFAATDLILANGLLDLSDLGGGATYASRRVNTGNQTIDETVANDLQITVQMSASSANLATVMGIGIVKRLA